MMKIYLLTLLLVPNVLWGQYLFNNDTKKLVFSGFTNIFICDKGTPLCFDGSIKVTPGDTENQYFLEVLDSVTRTEGKVNIAKYMTHPDGFKEKVFVDKFTFQIKPLPETIIYIGNTHTSGKIDTANLSLKIGLLEPFPESKFKIKEYTIVANKQVLIIKSSKITPQAKVFIKGLDKGTNIKIEVVYVDPLKKARRVQGEFYL